MSIHIRCPCPPFPASSRFRRIQCYTSHPKLPVSTYYSVVVFYHQCQLCGDEKLPALQHSCAAPLIMFFKTKNKKLWLRRQALNDFTRGRLYPYYFIYCNRLFSQNKIRLVNNPATSKKCNGHDLLCHLPRYVTGIVSQSHTELFQHKLFERFKHL